MVLKADLADEKGSYGIRSPSSAGIYRVVNNVFSRLQILSAKVNALEKRVQSQGNVRLSSPVAESSRSSVPPSTPINAVRGPLRGSPGIKTPVMRSSPLARGSPLRKTMLDEKLDPWEAEEIIRDLKRKEAFRGKISALFKGTQPLYTEAKT
jgi:hypothetical protein